MRPHVAHDFGRNSSGPPGGGASREDPPGRGGRTVGETSCHVQARRLEPAPDSPEKRRIVPSKIWRCSSGSPITATSWRPETRAGASSTVPAPLPRPKVTWCAGGGRHLPQTAAKGGTFRLQPRGSLVR